MRRYGCRMKAFASRTADLDDQRSGRRRADAAVLAESLLRNVGTRLAHTAAVVEQIQRALPLLEPAWRSAARGAAWLHDVGHSPAVLTTGFHPLDGARWLRESGWPVGTCRLVAWHTEPLQEGRLRGLERELTSEFDRPPEPVAAALAWADLTSSPEGERWSAERRLADILERYPTGSIVHRATCASLPALRAAVQDVEVRLEGSD